MSKRPGVKTKKVPFHKKSRTPPKSDETKRLDNLLLDLSKQTETQLSYWRAFQSYLAEQREMRRSRITDALLEKCTKGFTADSYVRVVDSRFQDRPLSSYGSVVVPPGGRFNFGPISTYYKTFQALYLASNFRTAFYERFLRDQSVGSNDPNDPRDARLDPGASFATYRIAVELDSVLDLRERGNLEPFLEVIAEIEVPDWLTKLARTLRQRKPTIVSTLDQLYQIVFDPNFTQWGSLIDQPSASQWLGHYIQSAGISGVIYPSVRYRDGSNLAIFPDSMKDSSSVVRLIDVAAGVDEGNGHLDKSTYLFQMQAAIESQSKLLN